MAYIGNKLADSYTSFAKQDFTTSATTSYTLDYPVANANEIALFINFVRQEPTTAYTATGTSLTLTSATSASDDMYAVFLGKALQTVNPPAGSVGLSQLSATGTKDSTTFLRGDNTFATAGGTNTPAFFAHTSSASWSNNTAVKVTYTTEVYDTDNAYDTSTGKFTVPTGEGGKYFLSAQLFCTANANSELRQAFMKIYVNGSLVRQNVSNYDNNPIHRQCMQICTVENLSAGDYVETYAHIEDASGTPSELASTSTNFFMGYKLVE